jgi:hypothetical protein
MLARNSGGPAHRVVCDGEARKFVGTGKRDGRTSKLAKSNTQDAITAQLSGDDTCAAEGYTVRANAPVLSLCRRLIKAGIDPARPLHAFRGDVLALTVTAIGHAAGLEVNSHGTAFIAFRGRRTASPMRLKRRGAA